MNISFGSASKWNLAPLVHLHGPNCGARIVPTPKEEKRWRPYLGLNQREIAARLKVSAAMSAYLEMTFQGRYALFPKISRLR